MCKEFSCQLSTSLIYSKPKVPVQLPQTISILREYLIIHFSYLLKLQIMLKMTLHMLKELHLQVISCLQRHITTQSEGCLWWMQQRCKEISGSLYISFHAQWTCSLYVVSVTVSLKRKPCCTESCLPLFSARIYIRKSCQLVSTYWELQLMCLNTYTNVK